jgi:L-threonylcarbamoyladenylate synthase
MLILKNLSKQIKLLSKCLHNGGTLCFPTETVYALACDATIPTAVDKIYKMKDRNKSKPLSILVQDIKAAKKYVLIDDRTLLLMKKFSPGPITYLLPNKGLSGWPDLIGIRIPDHPIAQTILQNYPNTLVGTSVNISGRASAKTLDEIPEKIKSFVDIIVPDVSKNCTNGIPSTIVDLSVPGKNKIVRQGKISKADIADIYYTNN